MNFKQLTDLDISAKTVLIRSDMNVPLNNGKISDDTRIRASLPSIEHCLKHGAGVIIMTHLGRPKEGNPQPQDSLDIIAQRLSELLGQTVNILEDWKNGVNIQSGTVAMLPNIRLNIGEKANSDELGKLYASLCDIFVNDAFGTAHRAEASTVAVAKYAKTACAGILLSNELHALSHALHNPKHPLIAIVGGSKVSTKLTVLNHLADIVDGLIVGGGIANTFLASQGINVGASLYEPDLLDEASQIIAKIQAKNGILPLPTDVKVAKSFSANAPATLKNIHDLDTDDMILDIGDESAKALVNIIQKAGTVVWNGPVGVFEFDAFANGSRTLALAIAQSSAFSIAGGGDTLSAITHFGISNQINYISTGGGAFLEFLEGKTLPAVGILQSVLKN